MKITWAMFRVLDNLTRGEAASSHCRGMSEFGSLHRTIMALRSRELIDRNHGITEAGRLAYDHCPWSPIKVQE